MGKEFDELNFEELVTLHHQAKASSLGLLASK